MTVITSSITEAKSQKLVAPAWLVQFWQQLCQLARDYFKED
jgi:hypothetical protein